MPKNARDHGLSSRRAVYLCNNAHAIAQYGKCNMGILHPTEIHVSIWSV